MKNHTKYAIMGVLTTGCRTGYAIKQLMDQSLTHFWKISYGQIYPTLKQLVEDGLATVKTTSDEGRPRKEYFLTEKGESELREWLEEPIADVPTERNEILLKLFFSRHQRSESAVRQVEAYRKNLEERFHIYQTIESGILDNKRNDPDKKFWLLTLDYGKRVTQAAIDWCTAAIKKLHEE